MNIIKNFLGKSDAGATVAALESDLEGIVNRVLAKTDEAKVEAKAAEAITAATQTVEADVAAVVKPILNAVERAIEDAAQKIEKMTLWRDNIQKDIDSKTDLLKQAQTVLAAEQSRLAALKGDAPQAAVIETSPFPPKPEPQVVSIPEGPTP